MRTQEHVAKDTANWQGHATKNVKLHDLAKRCLKDADGDLQEAAAKLIAIMESKPSIYRVVLDAFKEQAAYAAIRAVLRVERKHIQYEPTEAGRAADRALLDAVERNWYDYPLATMKLGDATSADLLAQAKIHEQQERGNGHKKRFMMALAERVGEQRVRDCIAQEQVGEIFKGAQSC